MAANPTVSIGVPVYNGAAYLRDALTSVLAQEFEDFEVIISDNASTDATEEICRAFASQDRRIRYHRQNENLGAAANYNRVFARSRGEFFHWHAHDDVLAPSYLRVCVEAFRALPDDVVLVYPRAVFIDHDGLPVRRDTDELTLAHDRPTARASKVVMRVNMANPVFGLIRSSALRQTRLIGPFVASDYVLLVELALLGKVVEVPDVLFHRREHVDSSRAANPSERDVLAWFDPRRRPSRVITTRQRLAFEYCRSALRTPGLTSGERAASAAALPAVMAYRRARVVGGRWKQRWVPRLERV